jgi:hypothetical protein
MKMYIAVLDEFPDYMTPTLVAHAVLGYHLQSYSELLESHGIGGEFDTLYNTWLYESFKKVVVQVNQREFDKIAALPDVGLFHENNTLGGKKACAVLVVDKDIPNVLKFAKLWEPNVLAHGGWIPPATSEELS